MKAVHFEKMRRRDSYKIIPGNLDLMLMRYWMSELSGNARKVVCYVAVWQILDRHPARRALGASAWDGPRAISLQEFGRGPACGAAAKGPGPWLSKSSVAEAIKEAIECGFLDRAQQSGGGKRLLASLYRIHLDVVRAKYFRMRHKRLPESRTG